MSRYDQTGAGCYDVKQEVETAEAGALLPLSDMSPLEYVRDTLKAAYQEQAHRAEKAGYLAETARRDARDEDRSPELIRAALTAFELQAEDPSDER